MRRSALALSLFALAAFALPAQAQQMTDPGFQPTVARPTPPPRPWW